MPYNFNVDPYYDDYDALKNFMRVLFRPGRAVQARELTQLQTILQRQVSSFANHIFQANTPVVGGNISVKFDQNFIIVDGTDPDTNGPIDLLNFVGKTITGESSNAVAVVTRVDDLNNIIYFDYRGGTFDDITPETIKTDDATPFRATITSGSAGLATTASCAPGILYTQDHFVVVEEQSIIVDPTGTAGTYYIGYTAQEIIVTSETDSSLFDPAQGSYNFNAPGADRYRIYPKLEAYTDPASAPDNFFSLVVVENGVITKDQKTPSYGDILDLLARRTYDQSGNYTVKNFPLRLSTNPNDSALLDVTLEAGKAYVMGYEVEKISSTTIQTDKGRDFQHANQITRYLHYGPYVDIATKVVGGATVDDISGTFDVSSHETATIYTQPGGSAGGGTQITDASGNPVTFRIASVDRNAVNEMRIFLADAEGKVDYLISARSIQTASGAWANIETYSNGYPIVGGTTDGAPILQVDTDDVAVKSITPNQTTFTVIRSYHNLLVTGGAGNETVTLTADDVDSTFVPASAGGLVSIVNATTGAPIDPATITYTVSAPSQVANDTVTITGTGLSGVTSINVIVKIGRNNNSGNARTKSLVTGSTTATSDATGTIVLNAEDVVELTSIFEDPAGANTAVDLNTVAFDNGQRDFYYGPGVVKNLKPNTNYQVNYTYYTHGVGALGSYFSADSYPNYENIGTYTTENGLTTYNLRNCLDFRRKLSDYPAGVDIPVSGTSVITLEYDYYVSRKDRIYVNSKGVFGVKKGIPARNPELPEAIKDTMTVYNLTIPPYTFNPSDVGIQPVDNKRYTMRDIGEIERRVAGLEYYTSMNMLEKAANNVVVTDANGVAKANQGIFVDDFATTDPADTTHPEYRSTIDPLAQTCRCPFTLEHGDLYRADPSATALTQNIKYHENCATLDYQVVDFIVQPKASGTINVNPYAVFSWKGEIQLTPASDNWVDVVTLPAIQKTIGTPVQKQVFTEWNSWQTTWTGTTYSSTTTGWGLYNRTTTTTATTTTKQTRTGVTTTVTPTVKTETNDKIVSKESIPYMRANTIWYEATGLRPGITLAATFDGVDVSSYCTNLTTDNTGTVQGYFNLPDGTFTTGTKEFVLYDADMGADISSASTFYTAEGVTETHQATITTIYGSKITKTPVSDTRTLTSQTSWSTTTRWSDPVAQTFLVVSDSGQGVYLHSVDLFFQTKDAVLPVSVHIVTTQTGFPTQNVVPFSQVTLDPAFVNTSSDGSAPTTFTFSDPVYLQNGVEYALVVTTNSTDYNIFYAQLGQPDLLDGKGIAEQPYTGVMFTSQNESTWTADQNADLKFTLKKCQFNTATAGTYNLTTTATRLSYTGLVGVFKPGEEVVGASSGASGIIVDVLASELILCARNATAFTSGETITGQTSQATANAGAETSTPLVLDTKATHVNFTIDTVVLDQTAIDTTYQFTGDTFASPFENGNNIRLNARKVVDSNTNPLNVVLQLSSSHADLSPVVSFERSSAILINTDDHRIVEYNAATKTPATGTFIVGETITIGGNNVGTVVEDTGTAVILANHNDAAISSADLLTGGTSGVTANVVTPFVDTRDLGTYITIPVNLVNPADDLRVIFNAYTPQNASFEVFYSSASSHTPKYVIEDQNGTAVWTTTSPDAVLSQAIVGQEVYIYKLTPGTGTKQTADVPVVGATAAEKAVVTHVDQTTGSVYLKSISNITAFASAGGTLLITTEYLGALPAVDIIDSVYTAGPRTLGDYVRHNDLLWRCNITGNPAEPGINASDWTHVPGVFVNDTLTEEAAVSWKPMVLEAPVNLDLQRVGEYTYKPQEVLFEEFTTYAVKIKMKGLSVVDVPKLTDFRTIAVL